ncbi:MAG: hypothetical protein ACE149_05315 [Armatimonadota bacterium]
MGQRAGGNEGGGSKVLEGVSQVPWESIWLTYEGSAYGCLRALEPELRLGYLMGVCGGAFRFFWHREAGPGMCNLLLLGEEVARRTFAPLGYECTYIADYERRDPANTEARYRRLIVESIDAGRPVVGLGILGPPGTNDVEPCIVTGYGEGGKALYGRSYFQAFGGDFETTESGYFRVGNWYASCSGLVVPGVKGRAPGRREVLREALAWAVKLARGPRAEFVKSVRRDGERWLHSGLAAYEPLADELLQGRDEYAATDLEQLWPAVELIMLDGIWLLLTTRENAATFLSGFARDDGPGAEHLARAAEAYRREAAVCRGASEWLPLQPSEQCFDIGKPEVRGKLREVVLAAKALEEEAVTHMEGALAAQG